jgi:hypothetical protein
VCLRIADAAGVDEGAQHRVVRAAIERCEREPGVEVDELVLGRGRACGDRRDRRDALGQDALPLCVDPAGKLRAAVGRVVEELAGAEHLARRGREVGAGQREHVDRATLDGDRHPLAIDEDPPPFALVEQATQLAEAPAQLGARVVRLVPEQVAQLRTRLRTGEHQVCEQSAHLA